MKICYVGPRPSISQHGVNFLEGKEDKYVYLMIALQILDEIDKDIEHFKQYKYDTKTERLSEEKMIEILNSYDADIESKAIEEAKSYEQKLDKEEQEIASRNDIPSVERDAWVNNLKIMREYRIQRAVNKIYYVHATEFVAQVIRREKIKEIDTPFYEKYWHVLQTIEGRLNSVKTSITTDLQVMREQDGQLMAKLFIIGH